MSRDFYAHENNTIMERSKLVCTKVDITHLKDKMQKMVLLIFVPEKGPIQSGSFTNLQI